MTHTSTSAGTDPSWSVLLIGGPSGTGKSILAQTLGRRLGLPWLQVDDIRLAFERSRVELPEDTAALYFFPETPEVWDRSPEELCDALIAVGRVLEPAIEVIIESHIATNVPIIIEGDGILPSVLDHPEIGRRQVGSTIQSVFLSEPDEEALMANFISRNRGLHGREIDELRTEARAKVLFGRWIEEQAQARGFPVLPSRPWDSLVERVLHVIDASAHRPPPAAR